MNDLEERPEPNHTPRAQRRRTAGPRPAWWSAEGKMRWAFRRGGRVPFYECVPVARERVPVAAFTALMAQMTGDAK